LRAIASPSPVPWCRREADESTCANSRNTSSWCSGAIPIPVSTTSTSSGSPVPAGAAARTVTRPPPAAPVKWMALPSRLLSTCDSFSRSAATGGRSAGRSATSTTWRVAASGPLSANICSTTGASANAVTDSVSWSAAPRA
jgi:hypothetical protein